MKPSILFSVLFSIRFPVLVVAAPAAGCDSPKSSSVEQAIAKAVTVDDSEKQAREALEAKARTERQERAAAKKSAEAARDAEIDAAAVLPEVLPKTVEEACDAAVSAYDEFMKRGPEKEVLLWHEGRRKKLAERRAACVTQANPTVAACQSKALLAPLPTLAELERAEAASLVFARCAEKFGKT
jgi:hypothetical protein